MKISPDAVDTFRREIRQLAEQAAQTAEALARSRSSAAEPGGDDQVLAATLATTVEKLQVAEEELRIQTDELLLMRDVLELERRRYLKLFEDAPDAYFVTDARGVIREANRAAGELLGIRPEFIRGKPITIYVDEASRRRVRRLLQTGPAGERVVEWFLEVTPRDGLPLHAAVAVSVGYNDRGEIESYRWLFRDVANSAGGVTARTRMNAEINERAASRTARIESEKQALVRQLENEKALREAAEATSRAKSEFLAVLSHELRTPLQALVGYTDLLEGGVHGALTEVQLEDLRRMQRSEQHLLRVVNSVLDFLKLESGIGSDLEPRAFSVPDVLRGLHTLIAPQLEAKKLAFVSKYEDPPPQAWADPAHVQQIVLNLLSNAVKFTPAGGSIAVETVGEPHGIIAIRVRDTGVGIEPEMLEAVFEPFVQARSVTQNEVRGTGLGLAISRRLASAMGGSLEAESSPGSGSTFTLRLRNAQSDSGD